MKFVMFMIFALLSVLHSQELYDNSSLLKSFEWIYDQSYTKTNKSYKFRYKANIENRKFFLLLEVSKNNANISDTTLTGDYVELELYDHDLKVEIENSKKTLRESVNDLTTNTHPLEGEQSDISYAESMGGIEYLQNFIANTYKIINKYDSLKISTSIKFTKHKIICRDDEFIPQNCKYSYIKTAKGYMFCFETDLYGLFDLKSNNLAKIDFSLNIYNPSNCGKVENVLKVLEKSLTMFEISEIEKLKNRLSQKPIYKYNAIKDNYNLYDENDLWFGYSKAGIFFPLPGGYTEVKSDSIECNKLKIYTFKNRYLFKYNNKIINLDSLQSDDNSIEFVKYKNNNYYLLMNTITYDYIPARGGYCGAGSDNYIKWLKFDSNMKLLERKQLCEYSCRNNIGPEQVDKTVDKYSIEIPVYNGKPEDFDGDEDYAKHLQNMLKNLTGKDWESTDKKGEYLIRFEYDNNYPEKGFVFTKTFIKP